MAHVKFTRHLVRYFPALEDGAALEIAGDTVAEIIAGLDERYPGLAAYIVNERGALRRHVNIFLDQELIRDRQRLQDPIGDESSLYVFQALSGG